ncbi:hypothetical protein [Metabacillus sp. FJAT-52054]|uniref:Uncharacterized protein n=1 Tax=Metabacillus sediminis TaxID=3117746 RepID=A0ABZ2NGL7_9BACI
MKKILVIALSCALCFLLIGQTNVSAAKLKFGDVKTVQIKMSKSQLQTKFNNAALLNSLTNNKAVDGGFLAYVSALAKSSAKKAGLYGFIGGATLMGLNKLTAAEKKDFAQKLKLVNQKKAKGIIITTKYKYTQSFDIGDSSAKGYWIRTGPSKIKTY